METTRISDVGCGPISTGGDIRTSNSSKLSSMRDSVSSRLATIKPEAKRRIENVRSSVRGSALKAKTSLREHPAKWSGVAVGAGIGAGLLGRYLLHRSHNHRELPDVIVIGGVC